jgi:hypothetical protein
VAGQGYRRGQAADQVNREALARITQGKDGRRSGGTDHHPDHNQKGTLKMAAVNSTPTTNTDAQDLVSARLTQIDALLSMLTSSGDVGDCFAVPHKVVMSTLWAAQDLLGQAQDAAGKLR